MRAVNLYDLETGFERSSSGCGESGDDAFDLSRRELGGRRKMRREGDGARGYGLPAAIFDADRGAAAPGHIRAPFASGVSKLDAWNRALALDESSDPGQ